MEYEEMEYFINSIWVILKDADEKIKNAFSELIDAWEQWSHL